MKRLSYIKLKTEKMQLEKTLQDDQELSFEDREKINTRLEEIEELIEEAHESPLEI